MKNNIESLRKIDQKGGWKKGLIGLAVPVVLTGLAISCRPDTVNVYPPATATPSAAAGTPPEATPQDANQAYEKYLEQYYAALIPEPTATPTLTPRPLTAEEKGRQLLKEQAGLTAEQRMANARQEQLVKEMCQTANEIYDARTGANQLALIAQLRGEPKPTPAYSCEEPKPTPTATPQPEVIYVPIPTPYPTATPQPEVTGLSLGLIYDSFRGTCNIVDRRTGAIVNPQAPTRISYKETGLIPEQQPKNITTALRPGEFAIIQGNQVNGQGNGVFAVVEAGDQTVTFSNWIKYGAVAVVGNRNDAVIELCKAIQAAHDNNWTRNDISIPGWMTDTTLTLPERSSIAVYPTTPPPEITGLRLGIRSDSRRGTCEIVDRRTNTAITNLQPPTSLDYKETGVGEEKDKFLTVTLKPGQFALTVAYLAERRDTDKFVFGPGAYIIDEAGYQERTVKYYVSDGAMIVYGTENDAMIGLCTAVQEAERKGWSHSRVVFPERWSVKNK